MKAHRMSWDLAPQMTYFWAFCARILPLLGLLFGVCKLEESGKLKVHCNELYWQYDGLS